MNIQPPSYNYGSSRNDDNDAIVMVDRRTSSSSSERIHSHRKTTTAAASTSTVWTQQQKYRGAVALNNIGCSLLERGEYPAALDTLKDGVFVMKLLLKPAATTSAGGASSPSSCHQHTSSSSSPVSTYIEAKMQRAEHHLANKMTKSSSRQAVPPQQQQQQQQQQGPIEVVSYEDGDIHRTSAATASTAAFSARCAGNGADAAAQQQQCPPCQTSGMMMMPQHQQQPRGPPCLHPIRIEYTQEQRDLDLELAILFYNFAVAHCACAWLWSSSSSGNNAQHRTPPTTTKLYAGALRLFKLAHAIMNGSIHTDIVDVCNRSNSNSHHHVFRSSLGNSSSNNVNSPMDVDNGNMEGRMVTDDEDDEDREEEHPLWLDDSVRLWMTMSILSNLVHVLGVMGKPEQAHEALQTLVQLESAVNEEQNITMMATLLRGESNGNTTTDGNKQEKNVEDWTTILWSSQSSIAPAA